MTKPKDIYRPLLSLSSYIHDSLMEKMNGKIFVRNTKVSESTKVSAKFTFYQNKISEKFLQITFLLVLDEKCVCVSVCLYIICCKAFTTKLSLPFVQLYYRVDAFFF